MATKSSSMYSCKRGGFLKQGLTTPMWWKIITERETGSCILLFRLTLWRPNCTISWFLTSFAETLRPPLSLVLFSLFCFYWWSSSSPTGFTRSTKFIAICALGVVHILRNHGKGGGSLQMITVLHRGGVSNDYNTPWILGCYIKNIISRDLTKKSDFFSW